MKTNNKFNLADYLGHSIFSLGFVLFPLLILIGGMLIVSHTFFYAILPDNMTEWQRTVAAWFIATAWEGTVLITTANHHHVAKWIPRTMALAVGLIVLFYLKPFDIDIRIQKLVSGILVAFTSWVFVELFNKKWKERVANTSLPELLESAQQQTKDLQLKLAAGEQRFTAVQSQLIEFTGRMEKAETFRSRILTELTCPHCQEVFESYNTARSHLGHCEKNPNSRKKVNGYQHS